MIAATLVSSAALVPVLIAIKFIKSGSVFCNLFFQSSIV
jgi:hypothetical protein